MPAMPAMPAILAVRVHGHAERAAADRQVACQLHVVTHYCRCSLTKKLLEGANDYLVVVTSVRMLETKIVQTSMTRRGSTRASDQDCDVWYAVWAVI